MRARATDGQSVIDIESLSNAVSYPKKAVQFIKMA